MTKESFQRLEFADTLTSNVDGSTWYYYGSNPSGVCTYKDTTVNMWGSVVYNDRLYFSVGNFLSWFESDKDKTKTFIQLGGDVGEPYSIVYPNFHMLTGKTNTSL